MACCWSPRINCRYSGSYWSTAASVSSVRDSRMPSRSWAKRMKARTRSGSPARYAGSAITLRGNQSASSISTVTGLHRSGSPVA